MAHIVIDARVRRSGTGRYVDRLLEHLQQIDKTNRYSVMVDPDDNWRPKDTNFKTVPCKYRQFSFNPLEQIGFTRLLKKLNPDLVHFSMTQQPLFYFGKSVTTTHDLTMFEYARPAKFPGPIHKLALLGYRFLFWWAHKKTNKIIVPTKYVADGLAKRQPFTQDKIRVTYEAADELGAEPKIVPHLDKPFIFHVGSPFPHKNIERLIDAFVLLKAKHPALKLVLAGKKEYYFEKLIGVAANKRFKGDIAFVGRVSDEQLLWLYQNAECYVLPSLSEGFGLPGVEAMKHGCPLVSSNATCLLEVYGEAAHYFDPKNVNDMARAITEVLDDNKLRETLIQKGRIQAAKYSWSKMAKQTLSIYQEILN